MTRAVLSLGSNVGDRVAFLRIGIQQLEGAGVHVIAVSPVYETDPVGGPAQDDYLNAVALVDTDLDADRLLDVAQQAEAKAGRVRRERWGPRELDVDVIAFGAEVRDEPRLSLPHPRAHERAFVLVPWLDLDRDALLPVRGRVDELVQNVDITGVRRRDDLVLRQ